jgi:two-component system, cell cycle sensor histidine kinase PleC
MEKNNKTGQNSLKEDKELALHYMSTLVDVARESFLILDSDFRVISGNPTFYNIFQVLPKETEGKLLFTLGNGQWNIPELKRLLKEILPNKKTIKDYEVSHDFETIGGKTMLLNARQIDTVQLIILAIEDATEKEALEAELAKYTKGLEVRIAERTKELSDKVRELEAINKTMIGRELKMVELKKEIKKLEKLVKNSNGNNRNGKNGKKK